MIIVDGPPYAAAEESPISFHRSKNSRGTVRRWTHSYDPRTRRWAIRDRDYRLNPAIIQRSAATFVEVSSPGDHFEFPGGFAVLKNPGPSLTVSSELLFYVSMLRTCGEVLALQCCRDSGMIRR
jgi:hypothetical protein